VTEERDKKHVLLIEDSPTQAQYVRLLLEDAGYRVTFAETGQKGIEIAEAAQPDVVLLDVVLPDLDGFSVCHQIRQRSRLYIPILMLTEKRTDMEDKVGGLTVGADEYLSKSADDRELLARVASLLRIRQVIEDIYNRMENGEHSYQTLRQPALTDRLTGLYNKHYFAEDLHRQFALARRYLNPLGCIMMDIDLLRDLNTRYGEPTGDWILQGVASLMKQNVREVDMIARYGGEEFVILLPMVDIDGAAALAERLRIVVEQHLWENSSFGKLHITVSLGVAAIPMQGIETAERLVACADKALHRAKANGRNRVEIYEAGLDDQPPSTPP
jgi:two-component system cell cycle response regulator